MRFWTQASLISAIAIAVLLVGFTAITYAVWFLGKLVFLLIGVEWPPFWFFWLVGFFTFFGEQVLAWCWYQLRWRR